MSAPEPAVRPQVAKLARTLRVPVQRLDYLDGVADDDLVAFRLQAADMLFHAQSKGLARIAAAAKALPAAVSAKLIKVKPNALLAARMAGVLEPGQAVDIAKRLSPEFLAEVAANLDTRRGGRLIAALPTSLVVRVAQQIARRGDWFTLADLVGAVTEDALSAAADALDGEAAVRTAPLIDDPATLSRYAAMLPDRKIAEMRSAAAKHGLQAEYDRLVTALPEAQRARFTAPA